MTEQNRRTLSSVLEFVKQAERKLAEQAGPVIDPLKVVFLRNFTVEPLEPYLKFHSYQSGIPVAVSYGGFDTVFQDALSPLVSEGRPDVVVVALALDQLEQNHEISGWKADALASRLEQLFEHVRARTEALVVINTFLRPFYPEHGLVERGSAPSLTARIGALNERLRAYAAKNASRVFLADWERLSMRVGEAGTLDRRMGYLSRAPFAQPFLDLYAAEIARLGRALRGRNKKCLVLDCDNTLWGGVVGEDGLNGIKLDPHAFPGRAYYDFQKSVLQLIERGVAVVLCSKNNPDDVWQVLDSHPHSLLRRKHLSAHRVNWNDKPANIAELAAELNLGLDAFVFVDDSGAECSLASQALPQLTVLQVPKLLSDYPTLLLRDGLFDGLARTAEDERRTAMYQEEARRRQLADQVGDLETYLRQLELKITVRPARPEEFPRIAQLTQKTNQFNLTTRRYSEAQIERFATSGDSRVFSLQVQDKFGEYGLTGVLIAVRESEHATVDTLLMSCRVLGRRVETEFTSRVLERLNAEWGSPAWSARYVPTAKNAQVAEYWEKLGFRLVSRSDEAREYKAAAGELKLERHAFIEIVKE